MKPWRSAKWLALITFSIVFALMGTLFVRNWDDLMTFPWSFNLGYFILTLTFHSLALGVTFLVWRLMVIRLSGFSHLGTHFRIYYLSTLAKRIPVSIWYIGGRLVMYKQVGVSRSSTLNAILLESILIGLASIFVFLVCLPLYSVIPNGVAMPVAGMGALFVIPLLARPQIFIDLTNRVLRRFHKQEMDMLPERQDILVWGGYYVLTIILAGLSVYCVPRAFSDNIGPGLADSIGIAALTTLVALLSIILPGGFGLKELTAGALLSAWMPLSTAVVISVAYRLLQTLDELVWAIVASVLPSSRRVSPGMPKQSKRIIDEGASD